MASLVVWVIWSRRLLRRKLRGGITPRRRRLCLNVGVSSVLGSNRVLLRVERLLLRRVVHALGVVCGFLLVERDALLRNGLIVSLCLGFHLELVRGANGSSHSSAFAGVAAVAAVSVNNDSVGDPGDEE